MNKFILTVTVATLGISSSTYAQKLMLGPIGGIDIATVAWDSAHYGNQKGTTNGLIAGGQLDVWFSNNVAFSTGLLLDQKGWHESNIDPTYPVSSDFTLNYIEIPLFLKIGFNTGSFQPYVFAGPSIGYMFWGYSRNYGPPLNDNGTPETGAGTQENDFEIDDAVNKIDFSIVGGAGVAYNLPSGTQLFLDAEYAFGLANILNYNNPNYANDIGVQAFFLSPIGPLKNRNVRIAGGILFPI